MTQYKMKMIFTIIIATMITAIVLPSVAATTVRIYPTDDAFVRDTAPSENFGSGNWENNLRVGYESSFGTDRSFLKFDLSPIQGETINSVTFSVFALSEHDNPAIELYHVADDSWYEETITWNNKPSYGTQIGSQPVQDTPVRVEFDVSSYASEVDLSFMMKEFGENSFVNLYSKDLDLGFPEDEEMWPYIEVVYEGDCTTGADTSGDGTIDMLELLNYISEWKSGSVQMLDLLNAISYWKAGEGC